MNEPVEPAFFFIFHPTKQPRSSDLTEQENEQIGKKALEKKMKKKINGKGTRKRCGIKKKNCSIIFCVVYMRTRT